MQNSAFIPSLPGFLAILGRQLDLITILLSLNLVKILLGSILAVMIIALVPSAFALTLDEIHAAITSEGPIQNSPLAINVQIINTDGVVVVFEHVNFKINATQGDEVILDESIYDRDGTVTIMTKPVPMKATEYMPVIVTVEFEGFGVDEITGPSGYLASKYLINYQAQQWLLDFRTMTDNQKETKYVDAVNKIEKKNNAIANWKLKVDDLNAKVEKLQDKIKTKMDNKNNKIDALKTQMSKFGNNTNLENTSMSWYDNGNPRSFVINYPTGTSMLATNWYENGDLESHMYLNNEIIQSNGTYYDTPFTLYTGNHISFDLGGEIKERVCIIIAQRISDGDGTVDTRLGPC